MYVPVKSKYLSSFITSTFIAGIAYNKIGGHRNISATSQTYVSIIFIWSDLFSRLFYRS